MWTRLNMQHERSGREQFDDRRAACALIARTKQQAQRRMRLICTRCVCHQNSVIDGMRQPPIACWVLTQWLPPAARKAEKWMSCSSARPENPFVEQLNEGELSRELNNSIFIAFPRGPRQMPGARVQHSDRSRGLKVKATLYEYLPFEELS